MKNPADAVWRSVFQKTNDIPSYPDAPTKRVPIRGLQFFEPATAWFCKLCEIFMGDTWCASLHLKSELHTERYAVRCRQDTSVSFYSVSNFIFRPSSKRSQSSRKSGLKLGKRRTKPFNLMASQPQQRNAATRRSRKKRRASVTVEKIRRSVARNESAGLPRLRVTLTRIRVVDPMTVRRIVNVKRINLQSVFR